MDSRKPLYRVSVSSSGLIFAMIVGAWAAYLVPMWLRRQDELNESRPTERFSTAIRLLSGKAALERRASRRVADQAPEEFAAEAADGPGAADVRAFAEPVTTVRPAERPQEPEAAPAPPSNPRARVLARRRRTTSILFLAFVSGGIFTAWAGSAYLWLPAVPGALLSAYIVYLRRQERRRYAVTMDRRRAEEAARRLRERAHAAEAAAEPERPARAVVEQTDHAEWVDAERRRGAGAEDEPDTWDPAPVPLPTYVSAPVAPRTPRSLDLDAPDTWSAARSTTAEDPTARHRRPDHQPRGAAPSPQRTPLFDQYAEDEHRRAAGE